MRSSNNSPAVEVTAFAEPAILIRINKTYRDGMSAQELYDATRGLWIAKGAKRDDAKYAMAVYQGVVREVYRVDAWYPAGTTSYHTRRFTDDELQGRWEFVGEVAEEPLRAKYVGKSVASYFSRGAVNPIMYVNCKS
jgi:hypothetical protein